MASNLAATGTNPKIKEILTSFDNDNIDMLAVSSILQKRATDVRNQRVNWHCYFQSRKISREDYNFIFPFDVTDSAKREALLRKNRNQCARTFFNLLKHDSKDRNLQYILVLIDDMLQESRSRVDIFHEYANEKKESVWGPFLDLLNHQDAFIANMTSRIIAKLACWSHYRMEHADLHFYLTCLKDQLKIQNNEYIQSVARCLQVMLRIDEYRSVFVSIDGISTLLSVLSGHVNFQVQYQLIFCFWLLTFNPLLAEKSNEFDVIPVLAYLLRDSDKEKVTRIILAVFRNLIEKPEDQNVAKEHCIAMVQCKVLKQLTMMKQQKFDDEDVTGDVEFLICNLQNFIQDLSSFDQYTTEVRSGRLEWSPVHKSKFWRENAHRLNEKNYELLRMLINLLETSKDPLVLSVASYDIGEYVRYYPRGKHVIKQLGGKRLVMQLLAHEDSNVRFEALLAVQKLMVHNKQLEIDQVIDSAPVCARRVKKKHN